MHFLNLERVTVLVYIPDAADYIFRPLVTDSFLNGFTGLQNFISPDNGVTPGYGSWDQPFPPVQFPPSDLAVQMVRL